MINNGRWSDIGKLGLRSASQRIEFRLQHNSTPKTDWGDKAVREQGKKRAEKEEASVSVVKEDQCPIWKRKSEQRRRKWSRQSRDKWWVGNVTRVNYITIRMMKNCTFFYKNWMWKKFRDHDIILSFSLCFCFNIQKFTSLKALEVPVRQVHPVAKGIFSRPESLKRASDGLQRNVSLLFGNVTI